MLAKSKHYPLTYSVTKIHALTQVFTQRHMHTNMIIQKRGKREGVREKTNDTEREMEKKNRTHTHTHTHKYREREREKKTDTQKQT